MNNNLFEREGTNKVFSKKNGEIATLSAPITRYVTPLALIIHVSFG